MVDQIKNKNTGEQFTNFVYDPGIKDAIYSKTPNYDIGYPIFVKSFLGITDEYMKIDSSIKDRIVIMYNPRWLVTIKMNPVIIKEKLKHEFLHVVDTYTKGKVIDRGSLYEISIPDMKTLLYLINSSEINARINEASKRLDSISDSDLNKLIDMIKKKLKAKNQDLPLYKFMIVEEVIIHLEDILKLEFIKKLIAMIVDMYNDKSYPEEKQYKVKVNLTSICQLGYFIKKHKVIKKNEENSSMMNYLPEDLDSVRYTTTKLSIEKLDLLAFNTINLLEWYIKKINSRVITSIYGVLKRRGIDLE